MSIIGRKISVEVTELPGETEGPNNPKTKKTIFCKVEDKVEEHGSSKYLCEKFSTEDCAIGTSLGFGLILPMDILHVFPAGK